ncbi:MAG TPA: hypothetical protein VMD99_18100 [Terriglobales bacterium]|nr:hypothetical protein [Terriglobales bacterium]
MSEGIMNPTLFHSPDLTANARADMRREATSLPHVTAWNPEGFAQEQIRGLVRRVFFSAAERPVRQVVFSAVEAETDVLEICRSVGEALSLETQATVCVAGEFPHHLVDRDLMDREVHGVADGRQTQPERTAARENREAVTRLRQIATRAGENLWLLPAANDGSPVTASALHQRLSEMRREFEYSVVAGRCAAESQEAMAMAQFADGIILVLSARHTRRATARWIKAGLEGTRARLMGTVLSDRVFPMPEAIYRRL